MKFESHRNAYGYSFNMPHSQLYKLVLLCSVQKIPILLYLTGFRCAYCYFLNQARKSKPIPQRSNSVSDNSGRETTGTGTGNREENQQEEERDTHSETVVPQRTGNL